MLRDKFLKKPTTGLESADPALVAEVQVPAVAAIDDATATLVPETPVVETPVVAEVTDTQVPVESELPAPTTPEAIDAVSGVAVATADPVVEPAVTEVVVALEDKDEKADGKKDDDESSEDDKKSDDAEKTEPAEPAADETKPEGEPAATEEAKVEDTPAEGGESTEAPETTPPEAAAPAEGSEPAPEGEPAVPVENVEPAKVEGESAETPEGSDSVELPAEVTEQPAGDDATPAETPEASETPTDSAPAELGDESNPASTDTGSETPEGGESTEGTETPESAEPAEQPADTAAAEVANELDAQTAQAEPIDVEVTAIEEDEAYADQLLEVNGLVAESEELDVAIESLVQRAIALESIAADLTEIQTNDEALTPAAAEMLEHAVSSATDGLIEGSVVPSMESFYGRTSATKNTTVALEGVSSAMETVWRWIRNALVRAGQLFANLWRKLMDNSAALASRAENILEQAKRMDDTGIYKASINVAVSPTVKRRLVVGDRPINNRLAAELEKVYALAEDVIVNFDDVMLLHAKLVTESLSSIDLDDVDNTIPQLPPIRPPRALRRTGPVPGDDMNDNYENSHPLMGSVKVSAVLPNSNANKSKFLAWTQRNLASVKVEDSMLFATSNTLNETTLPLLKMAEVVAAAEVSVRIAKLVQKHRSQYENCERFKALLLKGGDDFAKAHADEQGDRLARAKTIANVIGLYSRGIGNSSNGVSNYALKCVDASLRLASASLDYYRQNPAK